MRAGERTRTVNLLLTRQLLYQLSYASECRHQCNYTGLTTLM